MTTMLGVKAVVQYRDEGGSAKSYPLFKIQLFMSDDEKVVAVSGAECVEVEFPSVNGPPYKVILRREGNRVHMLETKGNECVGGGSTDF